MARPDALNSSGTPNDILIPGYVFPINPETYVSGCGEAQFCLKSGYSKSSKQSICRISSRAVMVTLSPLVLQSVKIGYAVHIQTHPAIRRMMVEQYKSKRKKTLLTMLHEKDHKVPGEGRKDD